MASLHMLLCLSQLPFSTLKGPMSRASSSACNLDSNHTPSDGLRRLEPIPSEKCRYSSGAWETLAPSYRTGFASNRTALELP
ncbi:hypothetical protein CCM_04028 [Cordyceps militaris CM01]|uniref:Secreted protein n=1 Tax=Cordyceps militaris (strain CM01) TaxID=983644 RepID=G3JDI0_CORMM|nr:uncharacterized protein CCM_04028 [Cordyceps militaris CM01]EGX92655.1 hypothetical protein CCM_04028 [Cordyceps militaris CM01]